MRILTGTDSPTWKSFWLLGGLMAGAVWAEDLDGAMAAAINAEQGGRKNITLGAMFQEEFRQQEGVKELKGGLLYKVEAEGTGKTPKLSDRVKVKYEGRMLASSSAHRLKPDAVNVKEAVNAVH